MVFPCPWRFVTVGLLCLASGPSCDTRRIHVPPLDPDAAARQALAEYDADKDGAIAGPELDKSPGLKAGRASIDANKDRRLTADEIAAHVRKYQTDKIGLVQIVGIFMLDGKPLRDAEVTLVPEKFLGPGVKPAKGTTDAQGSCTFQTAGMELHGAHPGIFRIEVSRKDPGGQETLPAKYNTETTLGIEVGMNSPVANQGLQLNLSSR